MNPMAFKCTVLHGSCMGKTLCLFNLMDLTLVTLVVPRLDEKQSGAMTHTNTDDTHVL